MISNKTTLRFAYIGAMSNTYSDDPRRRCVMSLGTHGSDTNS